GLTEEQIRFWEENGYLIIPDALDKDTVEGLLDEAHKLLEEFSLEGHPMTKFTTGGEDGSDAEKHVGDAYFLESNDKIRFFFEEGVYFFVPCRSDFISPSVDAFSPTGELLKPKTLAINKIGHALHTLSPPFSAISINAKNRDIAHSLGFKDPQVLQSMVICKQPEIGGAVGSHQDSTFLYTDPCSAVGFWYALEDCTSSNGCLSFAPGSHKRVPIKKRFLRLPEGGTTFEDLPENKGNGIREKGLQEIEQEETFVMGEVKKGSLVLIHGNVLHKSERNLSSRSRFIYTFHVIEGQHEYDEKNWLQPPEGGFSRLNEAK
ncbi:hypothetical protein BZA77DRAFT_371332, partial [Pyronema omphalodes]